MVNTNDIISTIAGNGSFGHTGDGSSAVNAEFAHPAAVTEDIFGNLYIAEYSASCIRWITTNGSVFTVAGDVTNGYSGDGGLATN